MIRIPAVAMHLQELRYLLICSTSVMTQRTLPRCILDVTCWSILFCAVFQTFIQVIIGYQSNPRALTLTPTRKLLAKRLARGSAVSVAVECVRNKNHVITALAQKIRKELKQLCSCHIKSLQRARDSSTLQGFNWDAIVDEAAEHAPNLVQISAQREKNQRRSTNQ